MYYRKSLSASILIATALFFARIPALADTIIDDNAPGWTWSGMVEVDDPALHGGTGHAGGEGTYGVYTFTGTGVDVYAMGGSTILAGGRHRQFGSIQISIDGNVKADEPLDRNKSTYNLHVFSTNGLAPGNHVLQVTPDGGWIVLDYISVQSGSGAQATASGGGGGKSSGGTKNDIPAGKTITLRAEANDMFVSAGYDGQSQLTANSKQPGPWEEYDVIDAGNNYVALKLTNSNAYVCADPQYSGALAADRTSLDTSQSSCEIFLWKLNPDGSVSLQALNGLFVTADLMGKPPAGLVAKTNGANKWESFKYAVLN